MSMIYIIWEEEEAIVNDIFYRTPNCCSTGKLQNIYAAKGKHYIEHYRGYYMSSEDFKKLMKHIGLRENKKGFYPLRVTEGSEIDWH